MELETLFLNSHFSRNPSSWVFAPITQWTREENKQFERALAVFDKETPERWFNIAATIPGKSVYDVMSKYKELEEDLIKIEEGQVPFPWYFGPSLAIEGRDYDGIRKKGGSANGGRGCDHERKKGAPWTEEEHRKFLQGLLKYGKGDWRNISRNYVVSKTPTQVASHAQKYFIRQQLSSNSSGAAKDGRRRPSIHDITTRNLSDSSVSNQYNNNSISSSSSNLIGSSSSEQLKKAELGLTWTTREKDLGFGGFGVFGIKSQGVQSTRYRIYG